jgi:hypothetical protein
VAMAQHRRHALGKGQRQGDGKRGSVHDEGLCSHDSRPKKAGPWLDGACSAEWVSAANRSSATHDTTARQRSARDNDGSDTCKATGSARWPALKRRRVFAAARCGTAGNKQTASSHGSVQPRLEGRVHNKGGLQCSPRALDATTRWWNEQRGMAWSRGSRAARSMASTATSSLCRSPAHWHSGEAANNTVKRKPAVRLGEGATPASSSNFRRRRRPSAAQVGGAAMQTLSPPSLLLHEQRSSGSCTASPVRRPRLQAGRRPVGPAARRRRAPPSAAPRFSTPPSSPSPPLILLLAVDREESPKGAAADSGSCRLGRSAL